jgi:lipopolysaccharide export system permease protein
MRLLNWYVTKGFLFAFFMAIAILTFAMTGANLVKVLDYVSRGIPAVVFGRFTLYILPIILTFTVPWAVMVAVMLLFGRLSADSEIVAMRACGVSILHITSPILLITVGLTALCLYLQVEIGPPLLGKARTMMNKEVLSRPLALFEPGSQFSFNDENGKVVIAVSDKIGAHDLRGVLFCRTNAKGGIEQEIDAETGTVYADEETQMLTVTLFDCKVTNRQDADGIGRAFSKELKFNFNYGKEANADKISVKAKYMKLADLMGEIRRTKERGLDTTELEVELNQRIAFALSPIAFLLLGLPLAIQTNRRETSVGLFLSVLLAGVYFANVLCAEALRKSPALYPQYLIWIVPFLYQAFGIYYIVKLARK